MIFASHQLRKMSDSGSKCPAEHWRPVGHFVQHSWNNFRDHCKSRSYNGIHVDEGHHVKKESRELNKKMYLSYVLMELLRKRLRNTTVRNTTGNPGCVQSILNDAWILERTCAIYSVNKSFWNEKTVFTVTHLLSNGKHLTIHGFQSNSNSRIKFHDFLRIISLFPEYNYRTKTATAHCAWKMDLIAMFQIPAKFHNFSRLIFQIHDLQ